MAVRATMAALIALVREEINDADSAQFTDQAVQDVLDMRRRDLTALPLAPDPVFTPALTYLDYYSDLTAWEGGQTLQNGQYATISNTLYTAEPLVGHWHFAANQAPPVFVSGSVFDIHGAAALLLRRWATAEALSFDFHSAQQRFMRSQKTKALRDAAKDQDAMSWPLVATATRSDLAAAGAGTDRTDDRGLPWGTGYGRR
jgi:hypothetical protein